MGINKETTREERAAQFKRRRWFRDMSESEIVGALCDFANAECMSLDKENAGLQKQVNAMKEAMEYALKRLDCEYANEDGCTEKAQIKLKSAIVRSAGKVV